jgi:hypothetical protein
MPDLCSDAGHGGAGIVDGPDLDGGVLGHDYQPATAVDYLILNLPLSCPISVLMLAMMALA